MKSFDEFTEFCCANGFSFKLNYTEIDDFFELEVYEIGTEPLQRWYIKRGHEDIFYIMIHKIKMTKEKPTNETGRNNN